MVANRHRPDQSGTAGYAAPIAGRAGSFDASLARRLLLSRQLVDATAEVRDARLSARVWEAPALVR